MPSSQVNDPNARPPQPSHDVNNLTRDVAAFTRELQSLPSECQMAILQGYIDSKKSEQANHADHQKREQEERAEESKRVHQNRMYDRLLIGFITLLIVVACVWFVILGFQNAGTLEERAKLSNKLFDMIPAVLGGLGGGILLGHKIR